MDIGSCCQTPIGLAAKSVFGLIGHKVNISGGDFILDHNRAAATGQIAENGILILNSSFLISATAPVTTVTGTGPGRGICTTPHITHHGIHVKQSAVRIQPQLILRGIERHPFVYHIETEIIDNFHPGHEVVGGHRIKLFSKLNIQNYSFGLINGNRIYLQRNIINREIICSGNGGNGKNRAMIQGQGMKRRLVSGIQRQSATAAQIDRGIFQRIRLLQRKNGILSYGYLTAEGIIARESNRAGAIQIHLTFTRKRTADFQRIDESVPACADGQRISLCQLHAGRDCIIPFVIYNLRTVVEMQGTTACIAGNSRTIAKGNHITGRHILTGRTDVEPRPVIQRN